MVENQRDLDYDKLDYWGAIDDLFINNINKNSHVIYADGNKSISTSNHKDPCTFAKSYTSINKTAGALVDLLSIMPQLRFLPLCTSTTSKPFLNTEKNAEGFQNRVDQGKIAGENFILKLKGNLITSNKTMVNDKLAMTNKIDIVCHSMGFAYSLGIIAVLQNAGIDIGNYYVLAPENPCSGTLPSNIRNRTWQYGSDERTTNENPIEKQDGVAPQCAIKEIDPLKRIYIPILERLPEQLGFTQSHSIINYEWIFNRQNQEGHVIPRN